MNGGLESQYRGSHYQGASGLTIKVDQDRLVETVAVAFPGSVDADKFVATQIGKWKGCAGATLTVNYADQPPVTWTVSGPKRSCGVAVVVRVQEGAGASDVLAPSRLAPTSSSTSRSAIQTRRSPNSRPAS